MADSAKIGITFFSPRSPFKTASTAEASSMKAAINLAAKLSSGLL
jgi:hypothetical protein